MKNDDTFQQRLRTVGRIISYGGKNVFRNLWLSLAAMAVMLVALVIILSTLVLNVTANNAIAELSKNLKVSIYLKDKTSEEARKQLEQELVTQEYVAGVEYVSKDLAKERFSQSFKNEEDLLEGLTLVGGDTLPASYEVSVRDLDKLKQVEQVSNQDKYKDIVESITLGRTDARRTIERAASAQQFITRGSVLAATIFTIISILIIFNTIRIAIFTRSEEIRSMKLIGATPGFIRGPFLVETSIYGIIAGVIAASTVYSLIISVGSKVANQAEFAETYKFFTEPVTVVAIFLGTILVGIMVGIFSSALAMEKHLKLKRW